MVLFMDKYHHIQYVRSKYIPVFLILFGAIFFVISLIFIFNNDFIKILFSKNIILIYILIFLYLFGSMFLILNYGIKIFTKRLNIIIKDEYFDINEGEKMIYYKDIKTLKLETIKHIRYQIITGYILILEWNNEKIKIIIYTGTSKKEKRNCDALLNFYEELNKKCNENNDVRHHCT
jgi:hypothetical protein